MGGDAPARNHGSSDGEGEADAADLAHGHESLTAFLHRQALSLRLSALDRAALQYLIESLNDDGYLEESLEALALGLAGERDLEQIEELVHRFTVALHLLQSLEPTGVGHAIWRNALACSSRRCSRRARQTGRPCNRAVRLPTAAGIAGTPRRASSSLPCVVPARSARARHNLDRPARAAPWATFCRCGAQCRGA